MTEPDKKPPETVDPPPKEECPVKKKEGASKTAVAALIVSISGFLMTSWNIYLTQLRSPRLEAFVAPSMMVYYQKNGSLGMHVPVGFINTSARGGAVLRARLRVGRAGGKMFEQEWSAFSETSSVNIGVTAVGPVAVGATSVVGKIVQFRWPENPKEPLLLQPGEYSWTLQLWTEDTSLPSKSVSREFIIDQDTSKTLLDRRQNQDNTVLTITFDKQPKDSDVS